MTALVLVSVTLVGIAATIVVLTHRPENQAIMLSVFGLALTVMFEVLQAPDVALSQLGVGAVVVPLMIMLTYRRVRRHAGEAESAASSQSEQPSP